MKTFSKTLIGVLAAACGGCVQQQVSESMAEHAVVEDRRFAREVSAQSPFDTVEMSWSEAAELMEKRNPNYLVARSAYQKATEQKPVVKNLTDELKDAVSISFGDVLKPRSLLEAINEPVTRLPEQLASLGKIKDISHEMEGTAWKHTAESVDAELKMREERVKLQQLLRTGELIDTEMARLESAPPPPTDADPKLAEALKAWRGHLRQEREKWLGEVRDFFNAEYRDVRFVKDQSGLPTYRDSVRPDLTKGDRWCRLKRSKDLVTVLQKAHEQSKPAVPGTRLVTRKFAEIVRGDEAGPGPAIKPETVRGEVRALIRNWREMKNAQEQARGLERENAAGSFDSIARVDQCQTLYKLRQQEIRHSVMVWMMDEQCWQ